MADYMPVNSDNTAFTSTASATVTAGQLLSASGNGTVGPAAVGDHAIGVAAKDSASGERVTVYQLPGFVHEVTVAGGGAATAGSAVIVGTGGLVNNGALATVAAAGTLIGIFLTTATAGNKARFIGV